MMSRDEYAERKRREIERLDDEVQALERQLEATLARIVMLEGETFEEALGEAQYDAWKSRRDEEYL